MDSICREYSSDSLYFCIFIHKKMHPFWGAFGFTLNIELKEQEKECCEKCKDEERDCNYLRDKHKL